MAACPTDSALCQGVRATGAIGFGGVRERAEQMRLWSMGGCRDGDIAWLDVGKLLQRSTHCFGTDLCLTVLTVTQMHLDLGGAGTGLGIRVITVVVGLPSTLLHALMPPQIRVLSNRVERFPPGVFRTCGKKVQHRHGNATTERLRQRIILPFRRCR